MATQIYGRSPSLGVTKDIKSEEKKIYGFMYPIQKSPAKGFFCKQTGTSLVRNNLKQLLLTIRGERPMLPDYGTNLQNFLFEPLDKFTVKNISDDISEAIFKYAPDVTLLSLQVFPSGNITFEGYQGIYIRLRVQINNPTTQITDIDVEIG